MNGFDVVVFDLDGTLADTAADLADALNHALEALGRPPLPLDQIRLMVGHGTKALLRKGLAARGEADPASMDAGLPKLLDFYAANICRKTTAYAGAQSALEALNVAGVRTAICTNKPEALARQLVAALGWAEIMPVVIGGDTLPVSKPDAAPLREAVARCGGGRALYVGDSITDADTARAAGLPFIAVSFGFRDGPIEALGADRVIDSFDELIDAATALA